MNTSKLKVPVRSIDHHLGALKSPIHLVEYGDFECPHCAAAMPIADQICQDFKSQLCYVYRHFPLSQIHPHSVMASVASEAADQQSKFWQMHHGLFLNQDLLSYELIMELVQSLDMNIDQFQRDMEQSDLQERVQKDFMGGIRSGVNGTPTFFINGIRLDRPATYDNLRGAIEVNLGRPRGGYEESHRSP